LQHALVVQGQVIALIARAIPRAMRPANPCYGAQGQAAASRIPPVCDPLACAELHANLRMARYVVASWL
jgi:hypothetical protein